MCCDEKWAPWHSNGNFPVCFMNELSVCWWKFPTNKTVAALRDVKRKGKWKKSFMNWLNDCAASTQRKVILEKRRLRGESKKVHLPKKNFLYWLENINFLFYVYACEKNEKSMKQYLSAHPAAWGVVSLFIRLKAVKEKARSNEIYVFINNFSPSVIKALCHIFIK